MVFMGYLHSNVLIKAVVSIPVSVTALHTVIIPGAVSLNDLKMLTSNFSLVLLAAILDDVTWLLLFSASNKKLFCYVRKSQ